MAEDLHHSAEQGLQSGIGKRGNQELRIFNRVEPIIPVLHDLVFNNIRQPVEKAADRHMKVRFDIHVIDNIQIEQFEQRTVFQHKRKVRQNGQQLFNRVRHKLLHQHHQRIHNPVNDLPDVIYRVGRRKCDGLKFISGRFCAVGQHKVVDAERFKNRHHNILIEMERIEIQLDTGVGRKRNLHQDRADQHGNIGRVAQIQRFVLVQTAGKQHFQHRGKGAENDRQHLFEIIKAFHLPLEVQVAVIVDRVAP